MSIWKGCNPIKYGVAIFRFDGFGQCMLPLNFGEAVLIYEENENGEWYRGCSILNRNIKGIFPSSFVHVKWNIDSHVEEDVDIATSKELSAVLEITSVLREWGDIWKQLFVKKAKETEKLKTNLQELLSRRSQIISGALIADQLKQVKCEIANKIDSGNKLLGLDLVVRDSEGNVIDVDRTGVIDLYKMHLESSQRLEGPESSRKKIPKNLLQYNGHNLYISIKNVVVKIGDDAEVFLTLYDGRENSYVSEHYVVLWTKQGMPKDLDKLHNMACLFTDLGSEDLQRDKLYIVCQIIRYGKMDMKDQSHKKYTQRLRRPFGIAVLHISDIVQGNISEDEDKEYFLQMQQIANSEDTESMIRRVIAKGPTPQQQGNGQGIWLTLNKLHGDLQQVKEEHPLLINQFTAIARKQGFPDVIMPGDIRNDMYLTLICGIFDKGRKSSLNMQVIVGVYNADGHLIKEVISLGAGEKLVSQYESTIYYHSEQPRWGEVVKLSIPTECLTHGTHVRFSFKHRATLEEKDKSQKVFSISYINLLGADGTCLQDSTYDLAVYKCEAKKIDESKAYMKLPSMKADVVSHSKKSLQAGGLTFSKTDSFKIQFQLCSTKLAQNVDLLGLLKWRTQKDNLMNILPRLTKVGGQEIVKFLQDTFDALFGILMEDASKYGEKVTNAVVFCIGLLADKKYHRFRSILDAYIGNLFSSTKAYITLIEVLQKNLEGVQEAVLKSERRETIMRYYKALEYLVKFIVRSRSLSERSAPGKGGFEFDTSINNLFSTIMKTMNMSGDVVLPLQGCALKYVPAVFGDLLEVFDAESLGHFARDLVEQIVPNRLQTQKLTCIHQLVKSPLFFNPVSRNVMRPMIVKVLKQNLQNYEELKICADVLNEMLSNFGQEQIGDISEDISYLVQNMLRCIISTVIKMNLSSNLFGNYVAFIIGILDLMHDVHYTEYTNSFSEDMELVDCLMEFFLLFREFVKGSVYPSDWMSMTMVQNNVILRALQRFSEVLNDRFLIGDSFQYQVWTTFFQLAVTFITQDSLQLEHFSETKRQKILERYGDMRMAIAIRVVEMWQYLGINKIRLIQSMVKPFLEMTLVPETELRRITIPVFFDMIECEFRSRQHFKQVESELIMHLDSLIESNLKGDEEYKELFNQILTDKFNQERMSNPRLYEVGLIFVETMSKLLSRLLDYRSVIQSEDNINNRMSCTVNILNFYQEIKREDMKERYLYKLCDLHLNVENYTEAAFTLFQHANLIRWSEDPLTNSNITSNRYEAKTQRELKERLYKDIIDYYDQGKMWEYGISRCKELACQYETETYDYIKLSQILEKQAKFFENIITTPVRPEPTYFRVSYYGRGFPTFLRDKVFIFRGDPFEQLNGFKMRLQVQFPTAQFLSTLDSPGPDITDSLKQWIQLCKVDPKPVERRKFQGKNVADQITKFYEVNDVSEFTLSRPFHKGKKDKDNEFSSLWIERTNMNTEDSFPGKLRWFEVINQTIVELAPIETAIDTLTTKNKEIKTMANIYMADPKRDLNPFTMLLNGVIDAAVMGGISNYEKIFFCKEYLEANPDHNCFIERIKELIVEQTDICDQALKVHKELVKPEMQPLHEKMEKLQKENKPKVSPYRKKQMDVHNRKVFNSGGNANRRSGERPQTAYSSTESPRSRLTSHVPSTLGERGNRFTRVVETTSPIHNMLPSMDSVPSSTPPPPVPGREPRDKKPRTNTNVISNDSSYPTLPPKGATITGYDKIPTVPTRDEETEITQQPAPYKPTSPKPPPKPDRNSKPSSQPLSPSAMPRPQFHQSSSKVESVLIENDDDDEPPPIIPEKSSRTPRTTPMPPPQPPLPEDDDDDEEAPPPPLPKKEKPR